MPQYRVAIPIAGHAFVEVEAENKEQACEKAMLSEESFDDIEWEALDKFNQGNVCYCPGPWEIEAEEI